MARNKYLRSLIILGVQLFLCGFFCDTLLAAKTVDIVMEIHKSLSRAEQRMTDNPDIAAKELAFARRQIDVLANVDSKNPNLPEFKEKQEFLSNSLRKWRRELTRKVDGNY